jgi:arylsulfatase
VPNATQTFASNAVPNATPNPATSGAPRSTRKVASSAFVAALALACSSPLACSPRYEGPYPHVVLISLDTTRADHVGCYGSALVKTPAIDRIAHEGILFTSAMAAAPTTLADHTSIMTGLYPHTHGVPRNGFVISPDDVMLAEIFKKHGFQTAAFLGAWTLSRRFGFDRGFDAFDENFDIAADMRTHDQEQRRSSAVTDAALRWVEHASGGPTFLFVHYFDAHAPYEPPPPFDRMYAHAEDAASGAPRSDRLTSGGPAELDRATRIHQLHAIGAELGQERVINGGLTRELATRDPGPPADIDRDLEALYSGEISYVDRELGRLIDGLAERGWLEHSIVIVTADHGESFAEHGDTWNHGLWVYDTSVHVPLIVRRSDRLQSREVTLPVSTVDIAPTLLALVGIDVPRAMEGIDLAPALDGGELRRGVIFSEATQPPSVEKASAWRNEQKPKCARDGRWKYIRAPYLDLDELYDLATDPGERNNLLALPASDARTSEARDTAKRLRGELDRWTASAHPRASRFDPSRTDDTLRRLNNLGYASGDEAEPPRKH